MASVSNGFFSTGSMLSLCCKPIGLDVIEHGGAAVAHQLHRAAKAALAEREHRTRWRRLIPARRCETPDREARVDERLAQGRAIGAFDGVDADPVQHQRHEMPQARFLVDDIAERNRRRRKRRRLDGSRGLAWRRRWIGVLVMEVQRAKGWTNWVYGVPNLLMMGCPQAILRRRPIAGMRCGIGDPGWIRTSDPQLRRLGALSS